MRVLLVNFEYPPLGGGAANATLFLARALASLGHEPTVLTCALPGLAHGGMEDGIRVHRLRALRRAADRTNIREMTSFMLASLLGARRVAREERIDAAVTFFTIPCGPAGWLLNRTMGIPYVVSLRGGDVPGHVPEIRLFHAVATPFRRAVLKRARAVIANAPGLARLSESRDPVPVHVIPNGVDTEVFRPPEAGEARSADFRILFVGRLHELKNIHLILRSAAELQRSGIPVSLDLVGDGPERPALEALAGELGIGERVRWHGWRPKEEVAALYRGANCLVNPSRYEGMPNTVLEAMASNLPVVASDVGGNNDLVRTGETGFLFALSDPAALTRALEALARDPALRERMGARGRALAVSDYSWRGVATRYLALLAPGSQPRADGREPLGAAPHSIQRTT